VQLADPAAVRDQLDRLRADVEGVVVTPDDPAYDQLRAVPNGAVDTRPAAIVRVGSDADVCRVVAFARTSGLPLAVRSGGHSAAGHSVAEGSVVVDLRDLTAIEVDVASRTVWAEAGLTAGQYTDALGKHGLATGFGDTGSVGIGGITLGGGIGYLVRKHGMTIDALLAADVVTADGEMLRVDAEHHPDLFWAIRGGGGNFGVVTRFQFRAHQVADVVGGMLVLPATPEVVAGFVALAEAAPDELSTIANVMNCPPMPFLPAEVHGQLIVMALMAYAGDPADAERVLAPFRALATPVADMLRPMPYPQIYPPDDPEYQPKALARTLFLDHVDVDVARTIVDTLAASDAPMRVAQLRVLGGAMARVPADATAFAHRSARLMAVVVSFFEGEHDRARRTEWVDAFAAALRQDDDGAYVNFLAEEGPERVRAAYPGATWDRLAAVKQRYDPTNVFRLNQNIAPAG
jgi:hypothetical protein